NWGTGLTDKDFANAFTALGILAARSRSRTIAGSGIASPADKLMLEKMVYDSLSGIGGYQPGPSGDPLSLPWRFPSPNHKISLGMLEYKLADLNPLNLANTWQFTGLNLTFLPFMPRLRLQVLNYTVASMIRPWFRLLSESDPIDKSAYISMKFPYPDIHMKWPLRLGFIPGNNAGEIVEEARKHWPSNENSILVEIGRENDNCDILVFDGTAEELLNDLKSLPVLMKCNLFIIRGPFVEGSPDFQNLIQNIAALSRANGFVFIKEMLNDLDFPRLLNCIVENLCHNLHMDAAISAGLKSYSNGGADHLIFLSNALANFRLEHQMENMIRMVKMLPLKTKFEIPMNTFNRLNIPAASNILDVSTFKSLLLNNKRQIKYQHEGTGATGLSEINKSLEEAIIPENVEVKRRERYISARTYQMKEDNYEEEKRAFLTGVLSKVIMRIGPPDKKWVSNKTSFPVEKLPPQKEAWGLTVVLGEPTHIKEPLIRKIKLPKDGPSTECEFIFTPLEAVPFEGRITVLHRGRVIQTAVLKIPVVKEADKMPASDQMELTDLIPVRVNLGNLEERRQFDLAFITNHNSGNKPMMTGIGKDNAWLANLEGCYGITNNINLLLSDVAQKVKDYNDGLKSKKGENLLRELIFCGCDLYDMLIKKRLKTTVDKEKFLQNEYMQIITTNDSEQIIPFEFIYEHEAPDNDATLCDFWKEGLSNGECRETCSKNFRKTMCPLGFWGLSKVIERQDVSSEEFSKDCPDYIIQTESDDDQSPLSIDGKCLVAASTKVDATDLDEVIKSISKATGNQPVKVNNWSEWETLVQENTPQLIVVMPHHAGKETKATLEINEDTIIGVQIRESHVKKAGSDDTPIVALLGCDTTGSAMKYGSFVQKFRLRGAAIVIGTVASVFGKHAAKVANMLVVGLGEESDKNKRLGEVMRAVKRKALLDGLIMSLCVVAFGDADWKLSKKLK
ncbi:MAG: hypothetical protein WC605_12645, partial [Bacteroidales bacterium]